MSPLIQLLASAVALMMAMGIGRFALTPQLPQLIAEGQFDLAVSRPGAAAKYLGYFIGAGDGTLPRRPGQGGRRPQSGGWGSVRKRS